MADLKTYWDNPGMPVSTDLGGDGITQTGTDPHADATTDAGGNACDPLWNNPPFYSTDQSESPNSVSGLPPRPSRWEPSATPPDPPSLQDRRPGTIDQQ